MIGSATAVDTALETIDQVCAANPDTEVGGVLFGDLTTLSGALILHACGPGPSAELARESMVWDASYIAGYIDGFLTMHWPIEKPIGRWHKHCSLNLQPSVEDRGGAEAFREALEAEAIVDLIVATDGREVVEIAAYSCTAERYDRLDFFRIVANG
jgi:hypothetical protein